MGLFMIHPIRSSHLDILKLNAPTSTKIEHYLKQVPLLGSAVLHSCTLMEGKHSIYDVSIFFYYAQVQGQMAVGERQWCFYQQGTQCEEGGIG